MMTCAECQAHLDDWLDGEIEPIEAARITVHLSTCNECRTLFAGAEELQQSLGVLGQAADRMAATPVQQPSRARRSMTPLARIAAALVFGTIVVLSARYAWTPRATTPISNPRITTAQPRDMKSDFEIETRPQTIVCADEGAPSMTVHYKSRNPKVQIVWLYQPYGFKAAEPAIDPTSGPADDTKGTRV